MARQLKGNTQVQAGITPKLEAEPEAPIGVKIKKELIEDADAQAGSMYVAPEATQALDTVLVDQHTPALASDGYEYAPPPCTAEHYFLHAAHEELMTGTRAGPYSWANRQGKASTGTHSAFSKAPQVRDSGTFPPSSPLRGSSPTLPQSSPPAPPRRHRALAAAPSATTARPQWRTAHTATDDDIRA